MEGLLWAITEDMHKYFFAAEKYFTIRVEKNVIRKILVDGITFELKTFSYIKAFFNNIVSSAEIKATSEVTKNVLVSIIKLYIKVRAHSFARDILQKTKSKLKKAKFKALRKDTQKCSKGNQNEQQ